MANDVIVCPYCKSEIPLTEAISHQIRKSLYKEFEAKFKIKEQELAKKEEVLSLKERDLENSKRSLEQQVFQKVKLYVFSFIKREEKPRMDTNVARIDTNYKKIICVY
ncbi:MAG: hypothetical protein AB1630_08115 [bacterium]